MSHDFRTQFNDQEWEAILNHALNKDLTIDAVIHQALRAYDLMEKTPGAWDAVNKITREMLGPKLHPDDEPPQGPFYEPGVPTLVR